MRLAPLFCLLAAGSSAACSSTPPGPTPPDPAKVFEEKSHPRAYVDVPYAALSPRLFRLAAEIPDPAVQALVFYRGKLHAGTSTSVLVYEQDRFARHPSPLTRGYAVVDLAAQGADRLIVGGSDRVAIVDDGAGALWRPQDPAEQVRAVTANGATIYVGTDRQLLRLSAAAQATSLLAGVQIRDLAATADTVFMATDRGVLRYDVRTATVGSPLVAPAALADDDVRALTLSEDGATLIVASATGLTKVPVAGGASVIETAKKGGLATTDLISVTERGGVVLAGHTIGATTLGAERDYYHSLRYMPDERVSAVALEADGTRWFGTPRGVGRLGREMTTLAARAAKFEEFLERRHWRMDGFVDDDVPLMDPWDPDAGFRHTDHDNDGLWTQMQIGPWCLAYSVTKDEAYYQKARKALDVMFLEIDIPGVTFTAAGLKKGFIARSLVRDDEGPIFDNKATNDRWVRQEYQGRTYYWKNDTSSDEYAGHFFGYPLFYDLCAKTEAEKEEIRQRIRLVADYLIEGHELLIDLDGKPTTFGDWKDQAAAVDTIDGCPDRYPLDVCLSSWGGGGWLNSLEILGHYLAAWHITGDQKYYDAYERLYTTERYGDMIPIRPNYVTITDPAIANHSDHELAMLSYSTLLRYEPNPERRARLQKSILDFFEYEKEERNPWQVSVIGSAVSDVPFLDQAIQTLKEMPDDWRPWRVDNAHRADADHGPSDRHGGTQFTTVFPYDEIRTMKWNGNPYRMEDGGSSSVMAPTPYLIAYWKLRYYGLITSP